MTTPPSDPPATSPSQRRSSLPWLIAGAVAVVAAVVTFLLTTGDDGGTDGGDQRAAGATDTSTPVSTPPSSAEQGSTYDLSTPEAAAASFAAAAGTGSGEALLELACVGRLACVAEHLPGASEEQLTEGRNQIREGVYELSQHLGGAEFGTAVDGAEPGTKDVPYRTPEMTADLSLTFVQSEGEWLFYRPAA
jgi:hypothetical protein